MSKRVRAIRGRVPSIATAAEKARELRKSVRWLMGDLRQLEARLRALDRMYQRRQTYYRQLAVEASRMKMKESSSTSTLRGRGPNVRDVAFELLKRSGNPQPIQRLGQMVLRYKGGRGGANFIQNLGAALQRDRRFKRAGRGIYGLRNSR